MVASHNDRVYVLRYFFNYLKYCQKAEHEV